jgi:hypothetical protein
MLCLQSRGECDKQSVSSETVILTLYGDIRLLVESLIGMRLGAADCCLNNKLRKQAQLELDLIARV